MRTLSATRLAVTVLFTIQTVLAGESSRIYVYADPHAAASSWKPVSCDGSVVAKIKDGYFFALRVSSGRHTFAIADGTPTFVTVNSNQDIFLSVNEHIIIGEPKILILTSVAPDLARQEMRWLPYIPPKKVVASTVSVTDPRPPEEHKFKSRQKDQ